MTAMSKPISLEDFALLTLRLENIRAMSPTAGGDYSEVLFLTFTNWIRAVQLSFEAAEDLRGPKRLAVETSIAKHVEQLRIGFADFENAIVEGNPSTND